MKEQEKRTRAEKLLEATEQYLKEHAQDEWLISGLAGIEEQFDNLLAKQQEITQKETDFKKAVITSYSIHYTKLYEVCLAAPFATRYGFFLPVICRGPRNVRCVSLTFDDGPDSATTPLVLNLLKSYQVSATFFVTGKNAADHPDLIARILDQGHTIGNHTYSHDPLIMLKSGQRLKEEIIKTQAVLAAHGIRPLVFRPPAGITNPKLGPVLAELGLSAVNFSCRAMDKGNRRISGIALKILGRVRAGDM